MRKEQNSFFTRNTYVFISVLSVVIFFVMWFLVVRYKLIPYLVSPQEALVVFRDDWKNIANHALVTAIRSLSGFGIGSIVGIGVALLMARSRVFLALINPFLLLVRTVPVLALIPIFILWFGLGELGRILFISLGCFFIVVIISAEAIRNVNKLYIWAGQALGCNKGDIYRRVIIPLIIPNIAGGLIIAITTAFPLCVAAEFLGAQTGLGFYLIKAEVRLTTSKMIAGVIAITILAIIFDKGVRQLVKVLTKWSEREET